VSHPALVDVVVRRLNESWAALSLEIEVPELSTARWNLTREMTETPEPAPGRRPADVDELDVLEAIHKLQRIGRELLLGIEHEPSEPA
jgi:hypothetical protein